MKSTKPIPSGKTSALPAMILLAILLAFLFGRSFLPGFVHFSNDGPLGQQNAAWRQLPAAFTGSWYDINDIGSNAGSVPPSVNGLVFLALRPVGYAKFLAPIALFILGLGAWAFFRQLQLTPLAVTLGALAAALNSVFFSTACWGVAGQQIAIGMNFLALALIVSNSPKTPPLIRWVRLALAGLAVGVAVMEGADNGAIFSLFIAAFTLFRSLTEDDRVLAKFSRGVGQVAVIALFAGFIAAQTIAALVSSSIVGIVGTGQDTETKAQHWDWATQWSFPKIETLSLFVPGLFGYRMDTPKDMMGFVQDNYKGGNYWGAMGRDPAWDRYFAGGKQGPAPDSNLHYFRFSGGGNYEGVGVTLVAVWAVAQSLRRRESVFSQTHRRFLWFWAVVAILSLLLAFGRFAPFYKFLYLLPYFSTIRNPCKFIAVLSWAIVVLFAYGIHGLSRRYLEIPAVNSALPVAQLKNWWAKVRGFDRNWTSGCVVAVMGSLLAWLIYATQKPGLVRHLQSVGFGNEDMAKQIAAFSIGQAGWFILLLALTAGLCVLVIAGVFAGKRAKLGGILLGVLLVVDLGRANLPYIIYWDYNQKYDIDPANPTNSTNPIINFLRAQPYAHRVIGLPFNAPRAPQPSYNDWFGDLYRIEWAQHHFPYYDIQSLDKIQMPRPPADLAAYEMTLAPRSEDTFYLMARRWELTNTRYLLGPAGFLGVLNEQLDPAQHRFRIVQRFDVAPKPGIDQPSQLEQLTAVTSENGGCALFEFTGALPRAKLYSNWQTNSPAALNGFSTNGLSPDELKILNGVGTNDFLTLKKLASLSFNPQQTVLLANPPPASALSTTNQNPGTVEFKSYSPKDIVLSAQTVAPSVLLLNDMFDPHWSVLVDGKPAPLLRCNFIMRGVFLPSGAHTVEFQFQLPNGPLYVTLTAIAVGIILCGCLWFAGKPAGPDSRQWGAGAKPIATNKPASNDLKR
jgi:hypothetical protein